MEIFKELSCASCGKTIEKNEVFYPEVSNHALNGITNLKSWLNNQKIYCSKCIISSSMEKS